jgi:hypothetical protein
MARHAIFTVVQDEPVFFPLWYDYYRKYYRSRHIYVLYHGLPLETRDPSWVLGNNANLVRIFRDESFDHTWLRLQVERFAAFLLGSYATVAFAEADEIIALNPEQYPAGDLVGWLDDLVSADPAQNRKAIRCAGYEVVHDFHTEPALDPDNLDEGILRQRNHWYPSETYSKTLIWRWPPHWTNGFHKVTGVGDYGPNLADPEPDPALLLIHLHKMDYNIARGRLTSTAARTWNRPDTVGTAGFQNRFKTEEGLKTWWFKSVDDPELTAPLVPIPDAIKDII